MKIILASSNEHKVKEINAIVSTHPLLGERAGVRGQCETSSIIEFILPPAGFDPIEDGETFEENSLIKAKAAWELGKTWTLADDSGLADTPQARIDRVLSEMNGIENRSARFKCCMTLLSPEGEVAFNYTGVCEGSIVDKQRGVNGFGYDPIFLVDGTEKTMAELSEEEKNEISHRGRALNEVLKYLANL